MNKKLIRLTESDLHRIVKESVNKILNESFKSRKLASLAKQHGGVYNPIKGGVTTKYISHLSDDEIGDILTPDEMNSSHNKLLGLRYTSRKGLHKTRNGGYCLKFNDGYGVILNPSYQTEFLFKNWNKTDDYFKNDNSPSNDGADHYIWGNPEAAIEFDNKKRGNTFVDNQKLPRAFELGGEIHYFVCTQHQYNTFMHNIKMSKMGPLKAYKLLTQHFEEKPYPMYDAFGEG
jgi:hypothetical protein